MYVCACMHELYNGPHKGHDDDDDDDDVDCNQKRLASSYHSISPVDMFPYDNKKYETSNVQKTSMMMTMMMMLMI